MMCVLTLGMSAVSTQASVAAAVRRLASSARVVGGAERTGWNPHTHAGAASSLSDGRTAHLALGLCAGALAMGCLLPNPQHPKLAHAEAATAPPAKLFTVNSIADAADKASPSVVNLSLSLRSTRGLVGASGSGVIIDPNGTIVTNVHVVVPFQVRNGCGTPSISMRDACLRRGCWEAFFQPGSASAGFG